MLSPAHGQCMHLLSTVPTKQAIPHNGNCCECLLLSREDAGHSLVEIGQPLFIDNYFTIMWLTSSIVGHKADCKWIIALCNLRLNYISQYCC